MPTEVGAASIAFITASMRRLQDMTEMWFVHKVEITFSTFMALNKLKHFITGW